ncbi:MAG: hypothetical protein APF80_09140 [Alphaproteobacteria bacterium BRH_c36]|nr:MAG: hypothetical protein APF80_14335 [Alphaproteobacteria bacterium BRH_c36]KUO69367.1 MAG: hypothetical protein APF80_09140 [Alphaproteobacteria bacterium BRH_c36]
MQLEETNIVGGGRVWRAAEPHRKAFATADVIALALAPKVARSHVFNHALAQRGDGDVGTHGELLSIKFENLDLQDNAPACLATISTMVTASTRCPNAARYHAAI